VSKRNAPAELANLSIEELIRLGAEVDRLIRQRIASEKQSALATLDMLKRYESGNWKKKGTEPAAKKHRAKPAPRYRDPLTGQTWTGRGMLPRWLKNAIKAGKNKEDFKI
jgi:DNA-binding protein H-NS